MQSFYKATTDPTSVQCSRRDLHPHGLPRRNLNPVGRYRDAAKRDFARVLATPGVVSIQPVEDSKTIQRASRALDKGDLQVARTGIVRATALNPYQLQCRMHCMAQRADAQLTFRLPKKIAGDLSRIAARRGLQRSDLLREAVEQMVADEAKASSHFERVKDLIGAASTGQPDLGSEHRRHLKNGFGRGR